LIRSCTPHAAIAETRKETNPISYIKVGQEDSQPIDWIGSWWPTVAAGAVRLGVTVLIAIYLAMYFELDEPHWAGWTVFSVSLATRASSIQKSTWRVLSTILGGAVSILLMDNFAQSTFAYAVALALWLGIMTYFSSLERGLGSYGFALLGYTVPIVTLGNVETPLLIFDTVVNRCSALILGIGCAHVSSVLLARGATAIRRDISNAVEAAAQACADWVEASRDISVCRSPPIGTVLELDRHIADALTEQPSLRLGAHTTCRVPSLLLRLIAGRLHRLHLCDDNGPNGRLDRIVAAARSFEQYPGYGFRSAGTRPLAMDRDTPQATRNALRTIIAISLVNAVGDAGIDLLPFQKFWGRGHAPARHDEFPAGRGIPHDRCKIIWIHAGLRRQIAGVIDGDAEHAADRFLVARHRVEIMPTSTKKLALAAVISVTESA
jgi:hypothetical protein